MEGPEASAVNINVINVELEPLILQRKLSKSFIARKHLILFFLISHAVDNDEFFFIDHARCYFLTIKLRT